MIKPQFRVTFNFGSGDAGRERYQSYLKLAKKSKKELTSWMRDVLDQKVVEVVPTNSTEIK